MKKIIHLIGHLGMGGAETLVKDYALHLDKNKYELLIVTTGPEKKSINEKILLENNARIIHLGNIVTYDETDNKIIRAYKRIKRIRLFKQIVKKEHPDVIHSHLQTNDYLIFINTEKEGMKLYHTLHNEINVLFKNSKSLYFKTTRYCVQKNNMTLIALHDRMKKEAEKLFDTTECIVINNTIEIGRFKNVEKSEMEIKKELEIGEESLIVGHIGRFSEQKNHRLLIDIFQEMKKYKSDSYLLLIGTGPLEEEIKNKVKDLDLISSVLFLENRRDIPELLSIMNVFVLPSLYEGFGNVLIEAQAAGVKCVVSNTIPNEVLLTNYITMLDLDAPLKIWSENILKKAPVEKLDHGLKNHDIETVMKEFEKIY